MAGPARTEALRLEAAAILEADPAGYQLRSCQECNSGHAHLHDPVDGPLFLCHACGHWWFRGVRLSDESTEEGQV